MATYYLLRAPSSGVIIMEAEMQQFLCNFWCEEDGQDLMEYSLLITFIALSCTAFLGIFHPSVTGIWQASNNQIQHANSVAAGN